MTKSRKKLWPATCPVCGTGQIKVKRAKGRRAKFRNVELPVPETVEIPTCTSCGTEWIDARAAAELDAALQEVYESQLKEEAVRLIQQLAQHSIPQNRVERILGLSQGYLSKVRSGASRPSAMLVVCLRLLSRDPDKRLAEIEGKRSRPKRAKPPRAKKAANAGS